MPNNSRHHHRLSYLKNLIVNIVRISITVLVGAYLLEADRNLDSDREDLLSRNRRRQATDESEESDEDDEETEHKEPRQQAKTIRAHELAVAQGFDEVDRALHFH